MKQRLVFTILAVALLALAGCGQTATTPADDTAPQPADTDTPTETAPEDSEPTEPAPEQSIEETEPVAEEPKTVVIEITGENFAFFMDGEENPTLRVKQGDTVRIEFSSTDGFHDLVVDEFGATEQVRAPGTSSVEFVADKTGTFDYYCSVGSHRQMGMEGQLIVE